MSSIIVRMRGKFKVCTVPGCGRSVAGRGLCNPHWQRLTRYGSVRPETPIGKRDPVRHNSWNGGQTVDGSGRVLIRVKGHPHPQKSHPDRDYAYVYRYRLVMEGHLGRYLLPSEDVHHKNGNKTDDRIDNLQVMSRSDHTKLHARRRKAVAK